MANRFYIHYLNDGENMSAGKLVYKSLSLLKKKPERELRWRYGKGGDTKNL